MSDSYQLRLNKLSTAAFGGILTRLRRGIEKEGLRVTSLARVAPTGHPAALGAALTHPCITTDYSEAQLEFITPVAQRVREGLDSLDQLHRVVASQMGEEYLWPSSMPCPMQTDDEIPIARYGASNEGRWKQVYREGLRQRYGARMQSISGIHYNFSLPDGFWPLAGQLWPHQGCSATLRTERYFGLLRNLRRHAWLLCYLFGASPVMDRSFVSSTHRLRSMGKHTLGLPFATSLRLSGLGYQSRTQQALNISLDGLQPYRQGLIEAMTRTHPDYEAMGVRVGREYRQLSSGILQLDNELYSDARPKCVPPSGEPVIQALNRQGVEYIELRLLDINPFLPLGIDEPQIRFLDAWLMYCLLSDSPPLSEWELQELAENRNRVLLEGRNPDLCLTMNGQRMPFQVAARQLLERVYASATLLDRAQMHQSAGACVATEHRRAVNAQLAKVHDSTLTPSGMIMARVEEGQEFAEMMLQQAIDHRRYFCSRPLSAVAMAGFDQMAERSRRRQAQLERNDAVDFDAFMAARLSAFG
ncbi:glutamate-cysteine ligase [Ferrimonas sediminum]|uniref:Glutamate--cysteine ligase n=1 Tax=Ferrimonas sediminum TaxID=718193 RepID=A0A1G8M734_9GAMM|nr:glutamate-cysteine ligase [Ferrimonas sediminum]